MPVGHPHVRQHSSGVNSDWAKIGKAPYQNCRYGEQDKWSHKTDGKLNAQINYVRPLHFNHLQIIHVSVDKRGFVVVYADKKVIHTLRWVSVLVIRAEPLRTGKPTRVLPRWGQGLTCTLFTANAKLARGDTRSWLYTRPVHSSCHTCEGIFKLMKGRICGIC